MEVRVKKYTKRTFFTHEFGIGPNSQTQHT